MKKWRRWMAAAGVALLCLWMLTGCKERTGSSYDAASLEEEPERDTQQAAESVEDDSVPDISGGSENGEAALDDPEQEAGKAIQNADGSYTVCGYNGTDQLVIRMPVGFHYGISGSHYFEMDQNEKEYDVKVEYSFDPYQTMDTMMDTYADIPVDTSEEEFSDFVVSEEKRMLMGTAELHYVTIDYRWREVYPCMECHVWTLPEGFGAPVVVSISYTGYQADKTADPEALIRTAYDSVTWSKITP